LLLDASPVPLAGRVVADVGTGTGAAADVALAAGARVIGLDRSWGMLAHRRPVRPPAVCADVLALPLADASVDVVVAAFLLNHLQPGLALAQIRRVLRPGGTLLASTWGGGTDPVKAVVTDAARAWGWAEPAWYRAMKDEVEPVSGNPRALAAAASAAGLTVVQAETVHIDVGVREPRDLVAYRLALPQFAPFVAGLTPADRHALVDRAAAEVAPLMPEWRPAVVLLAACVP
jgi:SAM-dependent methyltransferase